MKLTDIKAPTLDELKGACGVSKQAARFWDNYIHNCNVRYDLIRYWLDEHFDGDLSGKKILDWGCALGGVAILLIDELPAEIHCADVDSYSIKWLIKVNKSIKASILPYEPSLPFDNNYFDCIYGISVLTHLPVEQQEKYLSELRRISSPGSLIILTVASDHVCQRNKSIQPDNPIHEKDIEKLHKNGIIYHEYDENVLSTLDFVNQGSYGLTFHSEEYIKDIFGKYFVILHHIYGGLGDYQDVIIMTHD